jgi:DNA-binding CsgD family transcriptional regulator
MLATGFFETTSLKETARAMGVTAESARKYLQRIFLKTNTHSQAELVKLLSQYRKMRGQV